MHILKENTTYFKQKEHFLKPNFALLVVKQVPGPRMRKFVTMLLFVKTWETLSLHLLLGQQEGI